MSAAVPRNRRTVEGVRVTIILVLLTVSACGRTDAPHPEGASADKAQWRLRELPAAESVACRRRRCTGRAR